MLLIEWERVLREENCSLISVCSRIFFCFWLTIKDVTMLVFREKKRSKNFFRGIIKSSRKFQIKMHFSYRSIAIVIWTQILDPVFDFHSSKCSIIHQNFHLELSVHQNVYTTKIKIEHKTEVKSEIWEKEENENKIK